MEIILLKDVPGLGFKDEILNVKNGYGRNYIIPKGYGVLANKSNKFFVFFTNIIKEVFYYSYSILLYILQISFS